MKLVPLSLLSVGVAVSGCSTSGQAVLGSNATYKPGWSTIKRSMHNAARDPQVWGSLLAGIVLQVDDMDERLYDHLREQTPLFGSSSNANRRSDDWRSLTSVAYVSTALLVPAEEGRPWMSRARLLGLEWAGVQSTRIVTSALKKAAGRQRPNDRDYKSMPSGHTSRAKISAQMANLNVHYVDIESSTKSGLNWTFNGFAALTGWARVEAGVHYPSDVLAGWALGQFMSHLVVSFIQPDRVYNIQPELSRDHFMLEFNAKF